MSIQTLRIQLLTFAVAVSLLGCGDSGPPSRKISGTVTFDGAPVADGQITMRDSDPQMPANSARIENGKYSMDATLGEKTVHIVAYRDTDEDDGLGGKVREQYIPERYNEKSELKVTISNDGAASHDFSLEAP